MKNLSYVVWMLGWPLLCSIETFVSRYLLEKTFSSGVEGMAALFNIIVWFVVGKFLYEKH